jgi:TonB family protein
MAVLATEPAGAPRREWLWPLVFKLVVVALVLAGAWAVYSQIGTDDRVKRRLAQRISIINQPPPRKIEQKPQEPEVKEEVNVEKVEVQRARQANAPADNSLGVDEEGGAGGDSFGLAAKRGGRDIILLGTQKEDKAAAPARADFSFYTGVLQHQLQGELNKQDKIRHGNYRVELKLWIAHDGEIERFQLVDSTGSAEMDQAIQLAMADLPPLREPPPDMPQPVHIRLTSREVQ